MSEQGLCQGDNLSPTLFSCYINDLLRELNDCDLGICLQVKDKKRKMCVLAYADDIVILSDNASNHQKLLDMVHDWCFKW